jgi:hypothetical protein
LLSRALIWLSRFAISSWALLVSARDLARSVLSAGDIHAELFQLLGAVGEIGFERLVDLLLVGEDFSGGFPAVGEIGDDDLVAVLLRSASLALAGLVLVIERPARGRRRQGRGCRQAPS